MHKLQIKWWLIPVASIFVFIFGWIWAKDEIERNKRLLSSKEKSYLEFNLLRREYMELRDLESLVTRVIQQRPEEFNLVSYVERKAAEVGIKGHLKSLKQEKSVFMGQARVIEAQIQIEGVTLKQLIEFINSVDRTEELIRAFNVSVSANRNRPGYLDVGMKLSALVR